MAAIAPSNSSDSIFPSFTHLPPELRNQIWKDALPAKVGPYLVLWKDFSWDLTEADEGYDTNTGELRWEEDLPYDTHFEIPLVFVNREARGIALDWIHKHSIDIRLTTPSNNEPHYEFVRYWNPLHDALYVPLELWDCFLDYPSDRITYPDMPGRRVGIEVETLHLAVSEEVLSAYGGISDMFRWCFEIKTLCVVINPPDLEASGSDTKAQLRRWHFEDAKRGAYVYNNERGEFESVRGENRLDEHEPLYKLMQDTANEIKKYLALYNIRKFEIRPVFAVER